MREYVVLNYSEARDAQLLNLPEGGRIALRRVSYSEGNQIWILVNIREPEPEAVRDYAAWLKQVPGQDTLTRLAALKRTIEAEGLTELLRPVLTAFRARIDAIIAVMNSPD